MQRILIIITLILALGSAGMFMAQQLAQRDRTRIEIVSFPTDVDININGKSIGSRSAFYAPNQPNTITASKEGFDSSRIYIDLSEPIDDNQLIIELRPVSDEAREWVENNHDAYVRINRIASEQSIEAQERLIKEHPIVKHLPFSNKFLRIGYYRPTADTFEVTIHTSDVYIPYALNQIRQWGYDPETLNIRFVNQGNPFNANK